MNTNNMEINKSVNDFKNISKKTDKQSLLMETRKAISKFQMQWGVNIAIMSRLTKIRYRELIRVLESEDVPKEKLIEIGNYIESFNQRVYKYDDCLKIISKERAVREEQEVFTLFYQVIFEIKRLKNTYFWNLEELSERSNIPREELEDLMKQYISVHYDGKKLIRYKLEYYLNTLSRL